MTTHDVDILRHILEDIRTDIADIKAVDLAELKTETRAIKEEAVRTNGRIRKLELWRHGLEAVAVAHSWVRPAVVSFIVGAALAAFAVLFR